MDMAKLNALKAEWSSIQEAQTHLLEEGVDTLRCA